MAENLDETGSKLFLTTQILSAIGLILIIVFMIQNIPYLISEIFRTPAQMSTRLTYIIGLVPYLLCAIAYTMFLFKRKNVGLVFAFLAIYRIVNLIFAFIVSKSMQNIYLVDTLFTVAAVILVIIMIAAKTTVPVLKWLLAACTIAFTIYSIIINLTYLNNLFLSIGKTKSSLWPSILGILNFINLYVLIAVCFCLVIIIKQAKTPAKLSAI